MNGPAHANQQGAHALHPDWLPEALQGAAPEHDRLPVLRWQLEARSLGEQQALAENAVHLRGLLVGRATPPWRR